MESSDYNIADPAVMAFMQSRRSVPAKLMGGPGPDDDVLRTILEIAMRVPDHGKLSPWRFIWYSHNKCVDLGLKIADLAVKNAARENRQLSDEALEIERNRFLRAPVVVAVVCCARDHPKIPVWEQELSSGAVAMNMLIAANAAGFDAQWLSEWVAFDDALREELGLRTGEKITGFIHIGTRKNPKTERDRPELALKLTKFTV